MGENPLDMAKGRVETEHICYGLPAMTCISKALRDIDVMSACRTVWNTRVEEWGSEEG